MFNPVNIGMWVVEEAFVDAVDVFKVVVSDDVDEDEPWTISIHGVLVGSADELVSGKNGTVKLERNLINEWVPYIFQDQGFFNWSGKL